MNIQEILHSSNDTIPVRELEVFLQEVLQKDRSWIHAHADYKIPAQAQSTLQSFIARRLKNEPVAYIVGHKEFYGRRFKTDHRGLIPRPDICRAPAIKFFVTDNIGDWFIL